MSSSMIYAYSFGRRARTLTRVYLSVACHGAVRRRSLHELPPDPRDRLRGGKQRHDRQNGARQRQRVFAHNIQSDIVMDIVQQNAGIIKEAMEEGDE